MRVTLILLLLLPIELKISDAALADGGMLRYSQQCGDMRISVFTSPTPLRAGPIDVSVLVQDAESGEVARQTDVQVTLVSHDGQRPTATAKATFAAAENKLFRAANLELTSPGRWDVHVECRDKRLSEPICASFSTDAGEAPSKWFAIWPWFTWPAALVALFLIHRMLVARAQSMKRRKEAPVRVRSSHLRMA